MTEHANAVKFFRLVQMYEHRYPSLRLMFACPNGGQRNVIVARRLKSEGVRPGVPDYLMPAASHCGTYRGLAIELKHGKNTTTEQQEWWLSALAAQGWSFHVCYGWESAWRVTADYIGLPELRGYLADGESSYLRGVLQGKARGRGSKRAAPKRAGR